MYDYGIFQDILFFKFTQKGFSGLDDFHFNKWLVSVYYTFIVMSCLSIRFYICKFVKDL